MSYFIGSFPTAYLIARAKGKNIFEVGSGNMGGTNVMRAVGPLWGWFVIAFDGVKGAIAIVLARLIMPNDQSTATILAGLLCIAGHNWSLFVWLITGTLRGGKGAATTYGTLWLIAPFTTVAGFLAIIIVILLTTRYMSLAVLVAFSAATVWMFILTYQNIVPLIYAIYVLIISIILFVRFQENIQRLLTGTERRLGEGR